MKPYTTRFTRRLAVLLTSGALALLVGCSGTDQMSTGAASGGDAADSVASRDSGGSEGGAAQPEKRDPGAPANRAAVQTRAVIETGRVVVTSKDVDGARAEVGRLLVALGGHVGKEEATHNRAGRIKHATLVLRVPAARFDAAMDALERLGTTKRSERTATDVTTELIDAGTRVATTRASIKRLRTFLTQAPDIDNLIRLESELTQREAELRSLEAQVSYLRDQTSMATITLTLATPRTHVEPPGALDDAGFVAGLKGGWHALLGFLVVAATAVGAVLPFTVALLLTGVPAWLLTRAVVRRRRPLGETEPEPEPDA